MTDANPKKIMLVDDHAIVRAGVRAIFARVPDVVIDAEASSGQEALDLLRERPIDGVVLDISMPDRSGLDVLRRIRVEDAALPVLIFSMHAEERYALNVLRAGANGFFPKGGQAVELVDAVRTILAGRQYVTDAVAQQLATSALTPDRTVDPHERLSPREFEVYRKLAAGSTVTEVAADLFLSAKTVSTHRANILSKMGMKSNADLTYYAIKNQLLE